MTPRFQRLAVLALTCLCTLTLHAQSGKKPIHVAVDATDAPRKLLRSITTLPVKSGELTLYYPKWIPGEHAPSGPITDVAGFKIQGGGKTIPWRRDPDDMFIVRCNVPAGLTEVDVSMEVLLGDAGTFSTGGSVTANLLVLNWNQVLVYPKGAASDDIPFSSSLRLPAGWKFGTALSVKSQSGDQIEFNTVSLTKLVDSPVNAGRFFRQVELTPGQTPAHFVDIVSDSAAALQARPETITNWMQLVAETGALYGARHYTTYHFLLMLSDQTAHFGLEHHESSDDRTQEKMLLDDDIMKVAAQLLPHEMTHSWNGKFRRPAGLATKDYQAPMQGELLWVYEGLTEYLGKVLTARCGLWSAQSFREQTAYSAALLNGQQGRQWRPLADTAVAAQLLYGGREDWEDRRRGVDFYEEGALIWLEADALIRRKTVGEHTLDDFCRKFFGGESGAPKVIPYKLEDVVATLNTIYRHDWKAFFESRIYDVQNRAPLQGLLESGWHLAYQETETDFIKSVQTLRKTTDLRFSLGVVMKEGGVIGDVVSGQPIEAAGLAPGMKLIAINGRQYSSDLLKATIKGNKGSAEPIEILAQNGEFFKTYSVKYSGGERYPILERNKDNSDLLKDILAMKASPVGGKKK